MHDHFIDEEHWVSVVVENEVHEGSKGAPSISDAALVVQRVSDVQHAATVRTFSFVVSRMGAGDTPFDSIAHRG